MKIYLTRHGETDWNIKHKNPKISNNTKNNSVTDDDYIDINTTGIEQAKKLAEKLKNISIDLVICSPLPRAKQTAEIIVKGRNIPIIFDKDISVREFGEHKGKVADVDFDFKHGFWSYKANIKYRQAENIRDFFNRVYSFLDKIKEEYKEKNVLLVTHGSVAIPIYCYFNGIPEDDNLLKYVLANCEIAIYET